MVAMPCMVAPCRLKLDDPMIVLPVLLEPATHPAMITISKMLKASLRSHILLALLDSDFRPEPHLKLGFQP